MNWCVVIIAINYRLCQIRRLAAKSGFWWYTGGTHDDTGMGAISDLAVLVRSGAAVFTTGYSHRVARGSCPLHRHVGFEIVRHQRGRGSSRIASGDALSFGDGDVVIYAPRVTHDQIQETTGIDACIHIAIAGVLPRMLPACFHLAAPRDPWLQRELHDLVSPPVVVSELERISLDLRAGALLVRLLSEARATVQGQEHAVAGDAHAELADRFIVAHFRDLGRLEEIAVHLGIGYDHLRHVYRRCYGRSLVRRLMEVRVEHAKALLAHAPIPVAQVASEVGYATARHFSAVFRTFAGSTPAAWRAATRG